MINHLFLDFVRDATLTVHSAHMPIYREEKQDEGKMAAQTIRHEERFRIVTREIYVHGPLSSLWSYET